MNIERFHNELAMWLGYERIVNNKRVLISVEVSDDPVVTLKVQGGEDVRFKVSDDIECISYGNQKEIKEIIDVIHQSYIEARNRRFRFAAADIYAQLVPHMGQKGLPHSLMPQI